ncbi:MAG: hypothetical protein AMK69_11045 [Nitrospira bacterium SG8_3]|nr:MAG: hypothetical protein AMK69_11045 [Nitrospira bacterium SG8_3]
MLRTGKVIDVDGWAFVLESEPSYSEPFMVHTYWPLGVRSRDITYNWGRDLPIDVEYWRDGIYQEVNRDCFRPLKFRLENGGKTTPAKTEKTPIPTPSKRFECRWNYGHWEKLLKRGWVRA